MDRTKLRWNGWGFAAHKDELAAREEVWAWLAGELRMPALLATPARPLEDVELPPGALSAGDRMALAAIVGVDRVRDDKFERAFHTRGRSTLDLLTLRAGDLSAAPDAVVTPRATEEVLAVLALAAEREMAVIPFGGGTGDGVAAPRGPFSAAIALDISQMDRLLALDPVSQIATAQAGIAGPALEKALAAKGFMLGHYPEAFEFSTLGGWIAGDGTGQAANRYGSAKDWLASAQLATPRGLFAAEGPLKDLLIGSQGRFGVITEATLRVRRLPVVTGQRAYLFRDFASGIAAVRDAAQAEIPTVLLRLSDAEETRFWHGYSQAGKAKGLAARLMRRYLDWRGFGEKASGLVARFEGEATSVSRARRDFAAIVKKHGALSFRVDEPWKKSAFFAPYLRDSLLDRGVGYDAIETAASWSKLESVYGAVQGALESAIAASVPREGAKGVVMGRVGPSTANCANLVFTYVFPRALKNDVEQAAAIKKAAMDAIAASGPATDRAGADVRRAVKMALDPKGVLNPAA
jgi:alkyldihydroxyacetonephosphate synthase